MDGSRPHVLVVGGGIGGLCLAQGLRRSGIGVAVHERDPSPRASGQGYRIGIKRQGSDALRACLPPNLFALCVATALRTASRMVFLDHRLRPKFSRTLPPLPEDEFFGVNRQTLREILLAGLDGAVRFGQRFERFERSAGGRVRACFAGGGSATGDLLVGADGTASAVQPLLLPDAGLDELGWFLYGRTPILPGTLERLPAELVDSFNRMTAPDGVAVAVATCRTREPLEAATARLAPGLRLGAVPDYLAWQVDAGPGRPRPPEGDARALHLLALELLAGWPAPVRGIVEHAEPAATFLVRLRSARPVGPWHDPGVTLLGDAIHTMSPGRGEGANTALRDAALLAGQLAGVAAGRLPLAVAKRRYEEEMLRYSFETVAASKQLPFGPRPAPAGPG